ncbi:MAG: beta-ketoacyl synthase N-terminal-like domain-containing protein [Planctomycetota bacterium]
MNRQKEVVITGIGIVSPIGIGRKEYWDALLNGKSGIVVREPYADFDLPIRIAGPIRNFDAKKFVKPRKALKIMCDPIQFGCAAAGMAMEDAGWERESQNPDRIGTVFGTETFYADPDEVASVFRRCTIDEGYQHEKWGEFAMREIQPLWMLKYLPNMAASHISIAMDARGASNSICQGEASGALALVEAAGLIQRGLADTVITGGTGSQMNLAALLYRGTSALSSNVSDPEKACRPFDKQRDGMVVAEGAAAMILESAESAAARGAKVIARLAGWSRTFRKPEASDFGSCLSTNFQLAIDNSDMSNQDIGAVNANAMGAIQFDRIEAESIQHTVGDVPVVAHKGNFGNTGPGTSMLELAAAALAIENKKLPASINNTETTDCPVNVNRVNCELDPNKAILKSTVSSTGQICSIILKP